MGYRVNSIQVVVAGERTSGHITASVFPIHVHECRYWRAGTRHGPCTCGAQSLWEKFLKAHADDPWDAVRKVAG